jgi:plastocyanin
MRPSVTLLTLIALVIIAAACGGDDKPPAELDPNKTAAATDDGGAPRVVEVAITADGFNPASAKVTPVGRIIFNNNDSKPHTIVVPAGEEHVVKGGETFNFKNEGCCAATFSDKETRAKFKITVPEEATGLSD